ncbi:hypothetical protein OC845_006671 [Tilletia horrida]|nr:hypothetical protein OC845_006671 [Tilletia horrida]
MSAEDTTLYHCAAPNCDKGPLKKSSYQNHWWRKHTTEGPWPLAIGQGHRSDLPPGMWNNIINSWRQLPDEHPHKASGLTALSFLRNIDFTDCLGIDIADVFEEAPKLIQVLEDLEYALYEDNEIPGELYYTASGIVATDLKPAHLHASVAAMTALNLNYIDPDHLCYSAGVESHDPSGLASCNPRVPEAATEFGIPSTGDEPKLETAYTPRGHITKIHVDGFWDGAILTCLFGAKLLLHWPPSDHNLNVFGEHWPMSLSADLDLIRELEDIKIYHMTHGSYVYLPPGSLHAVFALETSAMVAFGIKHPGMIEIGLDLSKWLAEHLESLPLSFENRALINEQVRDGVETHCNSDDLWDDYTEAAQEARAWVQETF